MGKIFSAILALWLWFGICTIAMYGVWLLVYPAFDWHWQNVFGLTILSLIWYFLMFCKHRTQLEKAQKLQEDLMDHFKARRKF